MRADWESWKPAIVLTARINPTSIHHKGTDLVVLIVVRNCIAGLHVDQAWSQNRMRDTEKFSGYAGGSDHGCRRVAGVRHNPPFVGVFSVAQRWQRRFSRGLQVCSGDNQEAAGVLGEKMHAL